MKKSLLIITLSLFAFNLFGQKNAPEIIHRQHIVNVGSGIGFTSKYDDISAKPLLLVGYDYKAGFDLERISSSRLYYSMGVRFTNQFTQNTLLNENMMYLTIPFGFSFERKINSNLTCNIHLGGNFNFIVNNDIIVTNYFLDNYIGLGCTFDERFGVDFRYNSFGDSIEFIDSSDDTDYFFYNTYMLTFNYIFHQSRKEKLSRWWF